MLNLQSTRRSLHQLADTHLQGTTDRLQYLGRTVLHASLEFRQILRRDPRDISNVDNAPTALEARDPELLPHSLTP